MNPRCLTEEALRLLRKIAPEMKACNAVLAGGTALALRLSHRISTDFDFFAPKPFDVNKIVSRFRRVRLSPEVRQANRRTLIAVFPESKFSLFCYPYPFLKTNRFEGVNVASILDIASMKLAAITQRAEKRDFVDLYYILQDMPFRKAAETLKARYGSAISSLTIGKALVFFQEADDSPDPVFIGRGVLWETVRRFFEKHVRQFVLDLEAAYTDAEPAH